MGLNNKIDGLNYAQKKDYRFVFLYFIGILFVVMGHKGGDTFNLMKSWFPYYSFHLALFMFCSGYFYKDKNEKNIKKYIYDKFKKLILITLVWNIFYGLLITLLRYKEFTFGEAISFKSLFILPIYNGHQFVFNMGSWYVISLFLVEIFNVIVRKILGKYKNEYILFALYFALGFVGVYMSNKGLNYEWWLVLTRMLYFIPFYGLGIFYNKKIEKHDKVSNFLYFGLIFVITLFITNYYGENIRIIPSWCIFPDDIFLPFVVGMLGIAFWLRISKIVEPIIKNSKIINMIAENTYSIMIHHFVGFIIVGYIFGKLFQLNLFDNQFDWIVFKSDIWYTYYPNNLSHWGIVYIIAGIFIPIVINFIVNKIMKKSFLKFVKYIKKSKFV